MSTSFSHGLMLTIIAVTLALAGCGGSPMLSAPARSQAPKAAPASAIQPAATSVEGAQSASNQIANQFTTLPPDSAGSGDASSAAPSPSGSVTPAPSPGPTYVDMGDEWFSPEELQVPVGTTVIWRNKGDLAHNVTADDGSFVSPPALGPGDTFRFTFTKPGHYHYVCTIHADDMFGDITVK